MKKLILLLLVLSSIALAASSLEDSSRELATKLSTKLKGKTVVFLDLRDQQNNIRELGRVLSDQYLRVDLNDLGIKTVTRNQLAALLNELKLTQSGLTEAISSGRQVNLKIADVIVTGSVSQIGDKYNVSVEALDAKTGETLETGRADFPKTSSVQALWDSVLERSGDKSETLNSTSTAATPAPTDDLPFLETNGIKVQLEKCSRSNSTSVTCFYFVTNTKPQDQRGYTDDGTRAVTSDGNILKPEIFQFIPLGARETTLFQDIALRIAISYKISSIFTTISVLDLDLCEIGQYRFRNIPIR